MEEIKTKKNVGKIVKMILNIVFWVVIIGIMAIWLVDFIKVKNEKEPMFCISKKTHTFDDGTVEECKGLGYVVYEYNRSSMAHGWQFGPFFAKMK